MDESKPVIELDARRLLCPMPVIKTQNAVNALSEGDRLHVRCTDPGALNDIPAWCRINGHRIIKIAEDAGEYTVLLSVGPQSGALF